MSSTFIRSSVKTPLPAAELETLGLAATSTPPTISPPSNTCFMPSNTSMMPWPPASTTPAFFSTGSRLGVSSRAFWPAARTSSHKAGTSVWVLASAASAARRVTVRMVPSVGFITAL